MDSQLFYLLNLIFAIVFIIWFVAGRKNQSSAPSVLNLSVDKKKEDPSSVEQKYPLKYTPRERDVTHTTQRAEQNLSPKHEKALFIYNGHDWDAYQVLEVTNQHNITQITAKYQQLIRATSDTGKLEFYETAYRTLLKKI